MKRFFIALLLLPAMVDAAAQMPVRIGIRAGVNTSSIGETRTGVDAVNGFQKTAWKPGFSTGAVVDVPITSFFAIQPGFLFDYRHSSYNTSGEFTYTPAEGEPQAILARHTKGEIRTSWFHVPVLFSFRYALLKALELQGDFGPYLSLGLGGHDTYTVTEFSGPLPTETTPKVKQPAFGKGDGRYFRTDWGFKMGIGIEICQHYYIGAHYLAGVRNIARNKAVVRNSDTRAWQFTVGYNF